MKLKDFKNRRPYRCCIRGHHEGEPINYRIARGSDLRRKRKVRTEQGSDPEEEKATPPRKRKKRSQKQSTRQGEKRKRTCIVEDDESDDSGSDVVVPAVKPAKHDSIRNKR